MIMKPSNIQARSRLLQHSLPQVGRRLPQFILVQHVKVFSLAILILGLVVGTLLLARLLTRAAIEGQSGPPRSASFPRERIVELGEWLTQRTTRQQRGLALPDRAYFIVKPR